MPGGTAAAMTAQEKEQLAMMRQRDKVLFWVSVAAFLLTVATVIFQAGVTSARLDAVADRVGQLERDAAAQREDVKKFYQGPWSNLQSRLSALEKNSDATLESVRIIREDLKSVYHLRNPR